MTAFYGDPSYGDPSRSESDPSDTGPGDAVSAALARFHAWEAAAVGPDAPWLLAEAGTTRLYTLDVQLIVTELERLRRTGTR